MFGFNYVILTPSWILNEGYGFFSFKGKSSLALFVSTIILKSHFYLMRIFNFFNSCLDTFSFSVQYGMSIKAIGFDSKSLNKQLGVIGSCSFLSKSFFTLFTNLVWYPALENLFLISLFSRQKFELILHERYRPPFIASLLYLFGISDSQYMKNLLTVQ